MNSFSFQLNVSSRAVNIIQYLFISYCETGMIVCFHFYLFELPSRADQARKVFCKINHCFRRQFKFLPLSRVHYIIACILDLKFTPLLCDSNLSNFI